MLKRGVRGRKRLRLQGYDYASAGARYGIRAFHRIVVTPKRITIDLSHDFSPDCCIFLSTYFRT